MRQKILFVAQNMNVGGIQTSLLNLLKTIENKCPEKYEVSLFSFGKGVLLENIPDNVSVILGNSHKPQITKPVVLFVVVDVINLHIRIAGNSMPHHPESTVNHYRMTGKSAVEIQHLITIMTNTRRQIPVNCGRVDLSLRKVWNPVASHLFADDKVVIASDIRAVLSHRPLLQNGCMHQQSPGG